MPFGYVRVLNSLEPLILVELDDLALDPSGHRDDLADSAASVVLTVEVRHDVDTTDNRGYDEPAPDVLASQHAIGRVQAPVLHRALNTGTLAT
jgi:hypothetical protein